jgi:hypothetical protein
LKAVKLAGGGIASSLRIRALSRCHADHPYVSSVHGQEYRVNYLPAESGTGMFGGNWNWRGPIWMPVNASSIRALMQYYLYYGDNFKIECPTGSGNPMNLFEVVREIAKRAVDPCLVEPRSSRAIPIGGIIYCSTSVFMATTAPESAPVTKPVGPRSWQR